MSSWTFSGQPVHSRKPRTRLHSLAQASSLWGSLRMPVVWASRALHNHYFGQRARRRFGRRGRTEG